MNGKVRVKQYCNYIGKYKFVAGNIALLVNIKFRAGSLTLNAAGQHKSRKMNILPIS